MSIAGEEANQRMAQIGKSTAAEQRELVSVTPNPQSVTGIS